MSQLFVVTQRARCCEDFLTRIERLARSGVDRIILREKDLAEKEYRELALQCREICQRYDTPLSLNSFLPTAKELSVGIQLPLSIYQEHTGHLKASHPVGVSIHAPQEASLLDPDEVDYCTAGHIYETACKPGLSARGIPFLQQVCAVSPVPVMAIGGVTPERVPELLAAGAAGVCVMSEMMLCQDVEEHVVRYRQVLGS